MEDLEKGHNCRDQPQEFYGYSGKYALCHQLPMEDVEEIRRGKECRSGVIQGIMDACLLEQGNKNPHEAARI